MRSHPHTPTHTYLHASSHTHTHTHRHTYVSTHARSTHAHIHTLKYKIKTKYNFHLHTYHVTFGRRHVPSCTYYLHCAKTYISWQVPISVVMGALHQIRIHTVHLLSFKVYVCNIRYANRRNTVC
jgi:hypothetical protein